MSIIWALIGSTQIEEDGKMAMNVTPFVGTDNFNMETFNNMISQINNGVNGEISDVLAQLGTKAKIQTGSYVGTGTYGASNPCSLTFDFEPIMILFLNASHMEEKPFPLFLTPSMTKSQMSNGAYQSASAYCWSLDSVIWSNNNRKVSWYSNGWDTYNIGPEWQMNKSNQVYNYIVFY